MTYEEVIEKWEKKHAKALNSILPYVDDMPEKIHFPKEKFRQMVSNQIFEDFGYKREKKHLPKDYRENFFCFVKMGIEKALCIC